MSANIWRVIHLHRLRSQARLANHIYSAAHHMAVLILTPEVMKETLRNGG